MGEKKSESQGTGVKWDPPRGRRWSADDARAGLAAARSSGMRLSRFAREHGFHVSRLYWWMKALKEQPEKPGAFLPVQVVKKRAPSAHREDDVPRGAPALPTVDIVVGSKRVVRVGRGFDPGLLRAVLVALETAPC
jgi:transposase-like protein